LAVRFDSFAEENTTTQGNTRYSARRLKHGRPNSIADQIVDGSITTNNSNNDRELDGDFKRVNEVLESSKACVFQPQPFFSIKNTSPLPKTCTKTKRSKKIASFSKNGHSKVSFRGTPLLPRKLFISRIVFTPLNQLTRSSVISTLGFARSLFKIDAQM